MGMYSIWHWLIVLLVLAMPVVSVYLEKTDKIIGRKDLFIWVLWTVGLTVLSQIIISLGGTMIGMIIYLWLATGQTFLFLQRLARRCRDLGWNKYWSLLLMVPFIGLFFVIVLLVKPGKLGDTDHGAKEVI